MSRCELLLYATLQEVCDGLHRGDIGVSVAHHSLDSWVTSIEITGLAHFNFDVSYHVLDRRLDVGFLSDWDHPHCGAGLAHADECVPATSSLLACAVDIFDGFGFSGSGDDVHGDPLPTLYIWWRSLEAGFGVPPAFELRSHAGFAPPLYSQDLVA